MKKLNIENPWFQFMGRAGDIFLINLFFLFGSIPVITIGASVSAMYAALTVVWNREEIPVSKVFWREYKRELGGKLGAGILFLLTGGILAFDLLFLGQIEKNGLWKGISIGVGCLLILWLMVTTWMFPLMSRGFSFGKRLIRMSGVCAVRYFHYTVLMVILNCIPVVCIMLGDYFVGVVMPLYLVTGFSLTAYVNTSFLEKERIDISGWEQGGKNVCCRD